LSYKN